MLFKLKLMGKAVILWEIAISVHQKNMVLYKKLLYPDEQQLKPNFLCIYFPQQKSELFKSTSFLIFPSILLTLIIIGIFIVTLQIILRQKKISQIKE